jgi:hypothetical protein
MTAVARKDAPMPSRAAHQTLVAASRGRALSPTKANCSRRRRRRWRVPILCSYRTSIGPTYGLVHHVPALGNVTVLE